MAKRDVRYYNNKNFIVPVIIIIIIGIFAISHFIQPILSQENDKYRIGIREKDDAASTVSVRTNPQGGNGTVFDTVVDDKDLIRKEDAEVYGKIVTPMANEALKALETELNGYYMLTNWMVPYGSNVRIPDLKNMSVEEITPIKVVVYRDGEIWLVNLGDIADLNTFNRETGGLVFKFPYTVMAFALFEPKRD
jgi:hypothetical protein